MIGMNKTRLCAFHLTIKNKFYTNETTMRKFFAHRRMIILASSIWQLKNKL